MLTGFTFQSPPKLIFGWGAAAQLPAEAAGLGRRPLVVTGRSLRATGALERILAELRAAGLAPVVHEGVPPEPDLTTLQRAMDTAGDADCVIGIGGGSVLDVAKGVAALAGTGASAAEFFGGREVPERGRPFLALPTI